MAGTQIDPTESEFKWVTSQIAAHRAMAMPAFALYLQTFTAIVGGSIWLSLRPGISDAARWRFELLTDLAAIILGAAVSIMLWESWRGWKTYRETQSSLRPHVPRPKLSAGTIWYSKIIAVVLATVVFCFFNPFMC